MRIFVHGHDAGQLDWTHAVDTSLWYIHAVHSRWLSAPALYARLPPTACLHVTESQEIEMLLEYEPDCLREVIWL